MSTIKNTNYSFSFNYQHPSPTASSKNDDYYAFGQCDEFPLPNGRVLLINRHNGHKTIVTHDVAYSLRYCTLFRPLEAHAKYLFNKIPSLSENRSDTLRVLSTLAEQGILTSAKNFLANIKIANTPAPPSSATPRYFILTCDRPDTLDRLLNSITLNRRFSKNIPITIIDDSRQAININKNKALVNNTYNSKLNLQYFGPDQQAESLQKLINQLPHLREELTFLLARHPSLNFPSHGRGRNWALILSVGHSAVQLDDDILFQRHRHPLSKSSAALTSMPRTADFFSSNEEWQQFKDTESPDPTFGPLANYLGSSLPQFIRNTNDGEAIPSMLSTLSGLDLDNFEPESKILITTCGYMGDPGTGRKSLDWLFLMDKKALERLTPNAEAYRHNRIARNVWLGSDKYHLVGRFSLISGVTGLANEELLPPYFPLFRNEDYLFGNLTKALHPTALLLDLPWAVPHLPASNRQWDEQCLSNPIRHGVLDFLGDQIKWGHPGSVPTSPVRRLTHVAELIGNLAESSPEDLRNLITNATLMLRSQHLQQLQEKYQETMDLPDYWRQDLQTLITTNEKTLIEGSDTTFAGLDGITQPIELCQNLWRTYAQALIAWPSIREAAADIF